jgi:hypothetical protein
MQRSTHVQKRLNQNEPEEDEDIDKITHRKKLLVIKSDLAYGSLHQEKLRSPEEST